MMISPVRTKKNNHFKKKRSISSLYRFIEKLQDGNPFSYILLAGFVVLLQLSACKDSGSVGSGIGDQGSELSIDTLDVSGLQTDTLNSYAGNNGYFSAGRFQDPLFGDISVMPLLKPSLPSYDEDIPINENTRMELKLAINRETVYGDTLAGAEFNLVEVGELWRASAWRFNDDIQLVSGSNVGSFTITNDDTVNVSLSSEWIQKYGAYYNDTDSTRRDNYRQNFYGLAIVPQNSGKIISVDPITSRFIAINEASTDTTGSDSLGIDLGGWANKVKRSNGTTADSETTKLYNTLEQVLTFNSDLTSDSVDPLNVAKVDLVVYRDDLQLDESLDQLGTSFTRPSPGPLRLFYVDGDELPQSIDPGNALTSNGGVYDEDDNAYHFNLTNLVRGGYFDAVDSTMTFYVKSGSNDGVIRSSIIFNGQAGEKSPKLIITSTNNR